MGPIVDSFPMVFLKMCLQYLLLLEKSHLFEQYKANEKMYLVNGDRSLMCMCMSISLIAVHMCKCQGHRSDK